MLQVDLVNGGWSATVVQVETVDLSCCAALYQLLENPGSTAGRDVQIECQIAGRKLGDMLFLLQRDEFFQVDRGDAKNFCDTVCAVTGAQLVADRPIAAERADKFVGFIYHIGISAVVSSGFLNGTQGLLVGAHDIKSHTPADMSGERKHLKQRGSEQTGAVA